MTRLLAALSTVEKVVSCALLGGLLVSVMLQVVSRYVFRAPLPWTDEVSRFLLVWLTFIAAAYVMSERMHVTVDLALAKLGVRAVAAVDTIATIVVVAAAGVMTVAGVILIRETAGVLAPATQFPMPVVYSAGAVGFGLIALHGIATIVQNVRDPRSVPGTAESLEEGGL
ncbi:TRAP transporter small permease [Microbacterium halophytorum]|uniref:TRAP transporter small permease n=1 Tax=Microbacterium halophytorum TaxID=2067568 RepID=UPI000CFD0E34|nr:TRAP transporter small permease [Microbacterium halophytorum]